MSNNDKRIWPSSFALPNTADFLQLLLCPLKAICHCSRFARAVNVVQLPSVSARIKQKTLRFSLTSLVSSSEAAEPGGIGGKCPLPLFVLGEKVPFFGNESALFSWNRSALVSEVF